MAGSFSLVLASYTYRKNFYSVFLFLILFVSFFISGCDTEIVQVRNPNSFDSARYNWDIDTVNGIYCYNGCFIDSNKVIINGGYCMIKYFNGTHEVLFLPGAFGAYCLTASDENNVYFGGTHIEQNDTYRARLIKWNGASYEHYYINDSADKSQAFYSIFKRSNNEVWLSAGSGKVYKFDGQGFQKYTLDTSYGGYDIFMKDELGNLYYAEKIYYGSPAVDSASTEMFKFDGFNWDRVYYKIRRGGDIYFFFQNIGSGIFGVGDNVLYKFNGSDFSTVLTVGNAFLMLNGTVSGQSANILMCTGAEIPGSGDFIFNWNGTWWSKELPVEDGLHTVFIYSDERICYAISYSFTSNDTYIIKGTKK